MSILRLTQFTEAEDQYRVEVALEGDRLPRQTATSCFDFKLTPQDHEDLRWYLEDYLQYPLDPAPKIAARIEKRMSEVGVELFKAVFQANDDARDLWATLRDRLNDTRAEIITEVREATAIPWELLRDPKTDVPLALRARAFVRAQPQAAQRPKLPQTAAGPIRILLVICRPGGREDVPFRSVASRLIKGLSANTAALFQLDLLRPPTFEQLGRVLRQAQAEGKPYHIVHFDGHGTYEEVAPNGGLADLLKKINPLLLSTPRSGAHGYLLFENPNIKENVQLVDGPALGKLLVETNVPVLVLNACRSAHAEAPIAPETAEADPHTQARAFGSLAQEVMDTGLTGVVAMRYNVYVVTAAQFVADLYATLTQGHTLGEAVTLGRKQLHDSPLREIAYDPRPLQDWPVPVVYEAAPIKLFPKPKQAKKLSITLKAGEATASRGNLDASLPPQPDAGFFGRNESLLALDDADRRSVALQVLKQIPVLWIWDNVEPVVGFPAGTQSAWSAAEQKELADFLRAARGTKAKFLLTSRRDERAWLGDLPARITVPPMPMQERVQLARALAEKHGHRLTEVEDWRPLLQFTQGNPLTITVLVGQALRDGLKAKKQIVDFVAKLRAGETAFEDEISEGRSKSLGAALSYGFEGTFTETERKPLALLHFFQGFVDVDALLWMGDPKIGNLPEVRGLTREAGMALLDRAAEVGLLTAHGGGYYSIHPALPWYFKNLFDHYYPPQSAIPNPQSAAARAFVEAMGQLGDYYAAQYYRGNRDVISVLTAEEANLLHARHLARQYEWWDPVIGAMQGLHVLYDHTGRRAEWKRLVKEIVPDFVDPATDGPLPEREDQWSLITQYRVFLAEEALQWPEAERLQSVRVEWNRKRAAAALTLPAAALDSNQRNAIRTLAVSLEELGYIQRKQGKPDCVANYEEAVGFHKRIGDQPAESVAAFNLGHAYMQLPALRDLAQAEHWYRRSLELHDERDRLGRGKCHNQLGLVAYERFEEARAAKQTKTELVRYLNEAAQFYQQALKMFPVNAVDGLAVTHNQLGGIYYETGDLDRALLHCREAIRYAESGNNLYEAARTRRNVALTLMQAGRLVDAREYALAALHNYETYGDRAAEEIQRTQGLIAEIEQAMGKA
ncbi:CHAT domain-containing protein [candidate division KSB1 bacterium]|nr:CHAT domain-containing protein [candidate division KSB1 bacterium]